MKQEPKFKTGDEVVTSMEGFIGIVTAVNFDATMGYMYTVKFANGSERRFSAGRLIPAEEVNLDSKKIKESNKKLAALDRKFRDGASYMNANQRSYNG